MSVMKLSNVLGLNAESLKKQKLLQSKKLRQMIDVLRKELNSVKPPNMELLKELKRIEGEITFTFTKDSLAKLGEQILQVAQQIGSNSKIEFQLTTEIEKQNQLKQQKLQAAQQADKYIKLFSQMVPVDEATVLALTEIKKKIEEADTSEKVSQAEQSLKVAFTTSKSDPKKQVEELLGKLSELSDLVNETAYPWREAEAGVCDQVIKDNIKTLEDTNRSDQERQLAYVNAKIELVRLSQMLHPRRMPAKATALAEPKATLTQASQDLGGLLAAIKKEASAPETKSEIPTITSTVEPVVKEITTILDSVVKTLGDIETGYTTISPATEAQVELLCSELRNSLSDLKRLADSPLIENWSKCPFKVTKGSVEEIKSACDTLTQAIK